MTASSLNAQQSYCDKKPFKVGISKNGDLFIDWLKKADPSIEVIDLFSLPEEESKSTLQQCDGLILSGGPDINPLYYGKPEKAPLCFIDEERDRREWIFAKIAIDRKIPILGICRGFQLLNVIFGGTLIADISIETTSEVIHSMNNDTAYHMIAIDDNTLLSGLAPSSWVAVNSNHHQAIDRLADPFLTSARSSDQLIEAFEWKEKDSQLFLLAVEWHPERMSCSFSKQIAEAFVDAARIKSLEKIVNLL